jgi:hypothetical protein
MNAASAEFIVYATIAISALIALLPALFPVISGAFAGVALVIAGVFIMNMTKSAFSETTAAVLIVGGLILSTISGGVRTIRNAMKGPDFPR